MNNNYFWIINKFDKNNKKLKISVFTLYEGNTLIRKENTLSTYYFLNNLKLKIRNVIKYKNTNNLPEFRKNTITELDVLYM